MSQDPHTYSRRSVVAGVVWGLSGWLHGCGTSLPVGPREGQQAPAFRVATLGGEAVSLESAADRPSVLVFWASWCGPCRREAAEVGQLVESYGSTVQVVSINSGEDPTKARLTAEQWGMTWPVGLDPSGQVSRAFEVDAIPLVVILDAAGVVRFRGNGLPSDPHRILDGLAG